MISKNVIDQLRKQFGTVTHEMLQGMVATVRADALDDLTFDNGMLKSDLTLVKKINQLDASTRALIDDRFRERTHQDSSSIVGSRMESLSSAFYRSQRLADSMKQLISDTVASQSPEPTSQPEPSAPTSASSN